MSKLEQLILLAKEPSSDKRRELLHDVTNIFVAKPKEFSGTEIEYFGDIIGQLSSEMSEDVRESLSLQLSSVDEAPHKVVKQLASDEAHIAGHMLRNSNVLTDDDLIDIAESKGQEHLRAMAERAQISSRVGDAIVARGEDDVLVTLARNKGAELSREALETLVDKAETVPELQEPVATRDDLPLDLLNDMYFYVSNRLRTYILETNANVDEDELNEALKSSRVSRLKDAAMHKKTKIEEFVDRLHHSGQLNERVLVNFAKHRQINELIIAFARMCDVDLKTSRHVLFDESCEALTIAFRAMDFSRSGLTVILKMVNSQDGELSKSALQALQLYNTIPLPAAQRTMRFWKVRHHAENEDAA